MSCLLAIPEETAPPQIMRRASELIIKESQLEEPLMALRKSEQLYRVHLGSLADTRSTARGQIDPCLAIGRAKIDEARTFEEAREFLSTREVFAILQDRKTLKTIIEMT
jgi:membrane glycosyltransferase